MKQRYQALFLGLHLCTLFFNPALLAEGRPRVKKEDIPENRRPPLTQGRSAGSRGCNMANESGSFQLITPASAEVPLIRSEQPLLGWLINRDAPYGLTFRLYDKNQAIGLPRLLHEETIKSALPNTVAMAYRLPEGQLTNNREYLWQVELICDPDRPSSNISLEGDFKKVNSFSADVLQGSRKEDIPDSYLYDFYAQRIQDSNLQRLDGNFWEFELPKL